MKKTIWIINQTAGTLNSGWGERHLFLAAEWKKKGYQTYIFSGSYNHLFKEQPTTNGKRLTIEKVDNDITFCWVKCSKYNDGGYRKFLSNIVFTIRLFFLNIKSIPKPDIIIVSSMPIFPIIVGNYFKKKLGAKKLIVEIRDLWPLTPILLKGMSKYNPLIMIVSWFEKYAYRKSDNIVSLLPNAYKYVDKISKDPNKFVYIPNGIDQNLLKKEGLSKGIIEKVKQKKFIIGYTGTLGFANAMSYFIEASKLLKDDDRFHFVIVGDGPLKPTLKQMISDDQNNITFIDKVKKSQVQEVISYFSVCYLSRYSSKLYTYGVSYNKYFDYMLAKKPILESSEHINDQVEQANCGLIVPPENSVEIVNGIKKMHSMDKNEIEKLGANGYEFLLKHHTYEKLSRDYLKLFIE
ncbi:glycosyltransferase family 4 protein [Flavobacteriaceae bacterium S356]|uniref:Glycosyltransferase family 4 protein n=1 Tax=Asprobacillus argus TaxID=3076534 RepID=A0ABU3LDY2_9FLAO|nr:glycosyltransferase family 4 protein [Flavobacteriaceae bacterium S356]